MIRSVPAAAAAALLLALPAAAEEAPPPPWLMTGANTVTVAVTWNEAAVGALLPEGVVPAADLSGGVNVYRTEGGYGFGPYESAYAYVNVEGWDSASGAPARYILGGWYGPDPKVAAAMRRRFGAAVETGESAQRAEGEDWIGEGGDGTGAIRVRVTPGGDCVPAAGTLNYVAPAAPGLGLGLLKIPFEGAFCPAAPVSVEIDAPEGSPMARLEATSMLGGGQLKDGTFSFGK
ncbi:MAG: hypothetical protein R6V44_04015 [Paracoccaceae bacterium]